jgi:hypothetical protein
MVFNYKSERPKWKGSNSLTEAQHYCTPGEASCRYAYRQLPDPSYQNQGSDLFGRDEVLQLFFSRY